MSVQMPNITSYSGSWMIWFAEREGIRSGRRLESAGSPAQSGS